ncbi:N-acetyltransferase [Streptomyces alboniger]|uniref:N-acetyltransferase n=1 Tax=Streptomyces alboniger TaxID=132473 RepID=A0A5J6HZF1_STRAD|nr:N-acetyltransferase [Streptomyces alboniger]
MRRCRERLRGTRASALSRRETVTVTDVAAGPTTGCEHDRHEIRTPRLVLRTPTVLDLAAGNASGSDPEAQRWLGFPEEAIVPEPQRGELLAAEPGRGEFRDLSRLFPDSTALVAADHALEQHVGTVAVEVHPCGLHHAGGWLAPRFRGRGLGAELFAGAALLAHEHLGITELHAAAEEENVAIHRALTAAGFVEAQGPATHRLMNGRVVPVLWYAHRAADTRHCAPSPVRRGA